MISKKFQIEFLNKIKDSVAFNNIMSRFIKPSKKVNLDSESIDSLGLNGCKVIYYRCLDKLLVYRVISYSEDRAYSMSNLEMKEFVSKSEIEKYYNELFEKVELFNLLSVDYVYLYKSGVAVEGSDLRTSNQILNDKIIHCLYVNEFLNEVLIHNELLTTKFYRPYDGNYSDENSEGWSYEIVDRYLNVGRVKMFLTSDNLFDFNKVTKSIIVNPIELLTELECSCVGSGSVVSHCGDLGIQIS